MTLTAAAKIELIETALADGKYRTLQKQLRELRDEQQIIIQGYLSDSHESLKAEAERLIDELRPIAAAQNAIETVKQKTEEVLAFLPTGTSDLDWKTQIPGTLSEYSKNEEFQEKFRRIYNQLKIQKISVTYSPLASAGDVFQWNLHQRGQTGRLMWQKDSNIWTITDFCFQDQESNPIDEFADVKSF